MRTSARALRRACCNLTVPVSLLLLKPTWRCSAEMRARSWICCTLSILFILHGSPVSGKVLKNKLTPVTPAQSPPVPTPSVAATPRAAGAAAPECSSLNVNSSQLELSQQADIVVTGKQSCNTPHVGRMFKDIHEHNIFMHLVAAHGSTRFCRFGWCQVA